MTQDPRLSRTPSPKPSKECEPLSPCVMLRLRASKSSIGPRLYKMQPAEHHVSSGPMEGRADRFVYLLRVAMGLRHAFSWCDSILRLVDWLGRALSSVTYRAQAIPDVAVFMEVGSLSFYYGCV